MGKFQRSQNQLSPTEWMRASLGKVQDSLNAGVQLLETREYTV